MVLISGQVGEGVDTLFREELEACCPTVQWGVDMSEYSTFRTGGKVGALAEISQLYELRETIRLLGRRRVAWRVLGGGSNFLLASPVFDGVFLRLTGTFRHISLVEQSGGSGTGEVLAGCGGSLGRLVSWCADHGLVGIEGLAGIPGTVGGAVWMNAGAFDCEIGQRVSALTVIGSDGVERSFRAEECRFSYRSMKLPGNGAEKGVIAWVTLRLEPGQPEEIKARCRKNVALRSAKQPKAVGSAGSFFKNPPGDAAGRLIDAAGLKGLTRGGAMVSPEHGNFLINTGGATPEDIIALMQEVQERVYQQVGIKLEPEVVIL